ncbi:RNA methyltransferase [Candidatus Dojkabacteria bacterium]|nr:RNA methyltransferase [Candidatus Dojkabacteria bacterium]
MRNLLTITSKENPRVKELLKLSTKRGRDKLELFIVEGLKEVEVAASEKVKMVSVWFSESASVTSGVKSFLSGLSESISLVQTPDILFNKVSYKNKNEGILAVCQKEERKLPELSDRHDSEPSCILVLDRIDKPGNIGALLRTADAVNASAVIITNQSTDMFNPSVIRSSVGTFFTVPWVVASQEETKKFLKSLRYIVVGADPSAKRTYFQEKLPAKMALVVGNEHEGLSEFWKTNTDLNVSIPMLGKNDSLNVNAGTGVILYHWLLSARS